MGGVGAASSLKGDMSGLYLGLGGSLFGQVPYGMLTFGSYEIYKKALLKRFPVRACRLSCVAFRVSFFVFVFRFSYVPLCMLSWSFCDGSVTLQEQ